MALESTHKHERDTDCCKKEEKTEENEVAMITVLLRKPSTSLETKALAFKILKANDGDYLEVNG
jgi:hypothetical protein